MFPQFTQLVFAGIEVACWDALGRALGVPTRTFFGGAVHDELDYFGFLQGDDPETLAAHARRARGRGLRRDLPQGRPGGPRRRRLRRRRARGDRARAAAADRPERGVGPRDRGRPDPPARAVRPRLGRAADAGRDVAGLAHVRRSVGRQDRRRPGRLHDGQLRARAREGGGRRDRPGKPRRRRAAAASGSRRSSATRTGCSVNRHAFMESEISFHANAQVAVDDPEPDDRQPGHAPAARRAADARARRPALDGRPLPARRRARPRLRDRRGRGRRSPTSAGSATAPTTRSNPSGGRDELRSDRPDRLRRRRLRRRRARRASRSGTTASSTATGSSRGCVSSTGRCSAPTTTWRGSSARPARSGSSSRSPATRCST